MGLETLAAAQFARWEAGIYRDSDIYASSTGKDVGA